MARFFRNANSNRVDCGSPAAFDDLTSLTIIVTARLAAIVTGQPFLGKRSGALFGNTTQPGWGFIVGSATGQIRFTWTRATTNLTYTSGDNLAPSTNVWYHVAVTVDQGASAGSLIRIYAAPVGALLVEASSYSTATDGAGAYSSDAAQNLLIGNVGSLDSGLNGDIDRVALYTGALSLNQINAQLGRYLHANLLGHWRPGWGDADADLSGNGNNGTVTGATVADPAPISMAAGAIWVPKSPAAAAVTPLHLLPRHRVKVYPRRRRFERRSAAVIVAPMNLAAPLASGSTYLKQAQRRATQGGVQVLTGGV